MGGLQANSDLILTITRYAGRVPVNSVLVDLKSGAKLARLNIPVKVATL
jgi:hypothetical protein